MKKAVLTVIGNDRIGIIARVSNCLAEANINILDISQTTMSQMFTMIMLVELSTASVKKINEELSLLAEQMNLSIHLQNEELFSSMHRI